MAWSYTQLLNRLADNYFLANGYVGGISVYSNKARAHYDAGEYSDAIYDLIESTWYAGQYAGSVHCRGFYGYDSDQALICALHPDMAGSQIGEVTMEKMLAAMLEAETDEISYFVGLVDAYRQSVWNKPFNAEFYAALARGFEGG
jgi:hypothetical protein